MYTPLLFLLWLMPHAFHTSITRIDHNPKERSLEVSVRIFTDDLESALQKENNNQHFRVENNDKNDAFIEKYIRKTFKLSTPTGQLKPYTYVGKENEGDATWVYIEIPFSENPAGFKLQNTVLLDLFDDQTNLVNLTYNGERNSYLFNHKTLVHTLE